MSSLLYRVGRSAATRPWRTIGAWAVCALLVMAAANAFGKELEDTFEVPGLDSQLAIELLSSADSSKAGLTARVVVTPRDSAASFHDSTAVRTDLADIRDELATLPDLVATSDPIAALSRGSAVAAQIGAVSADGRVAIIELQYPVMDQIDNRALIDLEHLLESYDDHRSVQVEAGGELFFAFDEAETGTGEMLGLIAAVVILLVAFGSVIAMGLPIGMALFGLALGVSAMSLVTHLIEIPSWAPDIGAMIGLGVGIDYALFLVTRHRELLSQGVPTAEAAGRAVATAGQAVVFAGGTVVVAILGLAVAGVPFMTAAGVSTSIIVLIMVLASVTLLPAFLGVAGPWINRLGVHRRGHQAATGPSPRWTAWGRHVAAHAWTYTIAVTVLLVGLTAPVLALRLGFPDEGTQPTSVTQRRAYDLVADGFGPGVNGPLLVAIDTNGDSTVVDRLASAIESDPGVARVAATASDPSSDVATIVAHPTTSPQDTATVETISRLRGDVLPAVLQNNSATAHVGGQTAVFSDVAGRVTDRLPIFIVSVIVVSFLLLVVLFRSILVPLKAAILNLLSIGASYGVLVMVFQWGWGKELFGLESTVPIVSFVPMFMFAILFGLSMDYEVFLLSRVREHYIETGDNDASVVHGIASTARVITSAALIMISVFGGFVLGNDPVTKMFGLGLATAILVDATIVRIVLVPATMKLMGDANWWLPAWLDRLLPNIDLEHGAELEHDEGGLDGPKQTTRDLVGV